MSLSIDELHQLASLAYLEINPADETLLASQVGAILDYASRLGAINTQHLAPLFHPLRSHQRLREDAITEGSCLEQLRAIAPDFEDGLYKVPKVMDWDK